ncbi:MAG: hypothetical protein ACRYGK_14750 [Janthinobacterium lividum]
MNKYSVVAIDLHQLAAMMAEAMQTIDCPDCCGPVHDFIEHGGAVYREEFEWACFADTVVMRHRIKRIG